METKNVIRKRLLTKKNIMERGKKRQCQREAEIHQLEEKKRQHEEKKRQHEAEIHQLEQIAKKKEKHNQVMSVDFEANHLYCNAVIKSTRDKRFKKEAKQELLKEKQN